MFIAEAFAVSVTSMITLRNSLVWLLLMVTVQGCGGVDFVEDTFNSVQQTVTREPYVEWNTYSLYRFDGEKWLPILKGGVQVAEIPDVGERPAVILHGLGSDIASGRFNTLATSMRDSGVTAVLGFEYDTLDSIEGNGNLFLEAMGLLTQANPGKSWRVAGHSMGTLVARVALESGIPLNVAETGNRAVLVAGPHLGSEIADEVQARPNLFQEVLQLLVLNGKMEFRNLDGARCAVNGQEQGFTDLRTDSTFLARLNFEAANHHPQFPYRTVAGNRRGTDYEALNRLLGKYLDDGVVDVESANAEVIGQVQRAVGNADHSTIVEQDEAIVQILQFLGL